MRFITVSLTFLAFFISFSGAEAQDSGSSDVSYYLDDGKKGSAGNIIKINLASLLPGDLSFSYERKINKTFSIEGSAGLLLPYYTPEAFGIFTDRQEIIDPQGGYSFSIQPKIYYAGKGFDYVYTGLQYRRRHYNLEDGVEIEFSDFTINYGYQFFITGRWMLDYHLGIGFRFKKYSGLSPKAGQRAEIGGIVMPLALKIGYNF